MKKVTATITTRKGKIKTVKVNLDETTAALLEESGDHALLTAYVAEEYEARNLAQRETRRRRSLEYLNECGWEFEDKQPDPLEALILTEQAAIMQEALQTLTERQATIVKEHVLKRQTFRSLGETLDVRYSVVRADYRKAIKKLQNFFILLQSKK